MPMSPRLLRPRQTGFTPRSISGLALWLDAADSSTLYTTDAGPVTAVSAPTEISGCVGWWDADDPASITQSSGLVSQWNDKSGGNRHATAAAAECPSVTQVNLRTAFSFNGSSNQMSLAMPLSSAATIFLVCTPSSTNDSYIVAGSGIGSSPAIISRYTNVVRRDFEFWNGAGSDRLIIATTQPGVSIVSVTHTDGGSVGGNLNGVSAATKTTAAGTMAGGQLVRFGAATGNTAYAATTICEVIVFNTALSPTDRARVEAYLAAKWGISGVHTAATATNDPVGAWLDKSGNGRHATQGTGTARPTISAISQNGRSNLTFNGTSGYFRCNSGAAFRARIAYAVVRRTGAPPSFSPIYCQRGVNSTVAANSAQEFYVSSRDGTGKLFGIAAAGGVMRVDGAPVTPVNSGVSNLHEGDLLPNTTAFRAIAVQGNITDTAGTQIPFVGLDPFGLTRTYPMQLCELLVYDSLLDAAKFRGLERYLAAKWGIAIAPQVSNADAQDWVNRVYANGGTVSATTASAVNTFCNAIDAAGIRDRFYRLNLFCGNSDAALAAVRTPLFRGPSLTGTQYGNATDTNANFVQGDYAEGVGLSTVSGGTKHLDTGLATSALPAGVISAGHLAAWHGPLTSQGDYDPVLIGALNGTTDRATLHTTIRGTANAGDSGRWGKATIVTAADGAIGFSKPSAFLLTQRTSETNLELWRNGAVVATNTASTTGIAGIPHSFTVFRLNNTGTVGGELNLGGPLRGYSVGDDMTSGQVLAFRAAWSAFNTAMGRTA